MQQMILQKKPSRQWIKITLSLIASSIHVACYKSEPVVWVNLEHAQELLSHPVPYFQNSNIRESVQIQKESLQKVEPSHTTKRETEKKRLQAVAVINAEKNRLLIGLTKAYEAELRSAVAILASKLEADRKLRSNELSEATINKISTLIKENAPRHGLLIAQLAQLVGWPDSGSLIVRPYGNDSQAIQKLTDRAEELREEIRTISGDITNQINEILLEETLFNQEEKRHIKTQIEAAYHEATEEATRLAKKKLDAMAKFSFLDVLEETSDILRTQPTRQVTLPRISVVFHNLPDSRPPQIPKSVLEGRLNIWLRLQGYKLSSGPQNAPDLTEEFVTWMRIK